MTEQDWAASDNIEDMLRAVANHSPSNRKLLLFAVTCFRETRPDPFVEEELEALERYADGRVTLEELQAYFRYPNWVYDQDMSTLRLLDFSFEMVATVVNEAAATLAGRATTYHAYQTAKRAAQANQADLVRCIFGNPFRPSPPLKASLRSPAIAGLAQTIYELRSFERLPEVASRLEEAGVNDSELLGHLRAEGPHARGCWAIDCILGRL